MKNIKCKLCQGEKIEVVATKVRDDPNISVFKCIQCGLVFLSNGFRSDVTYYTDGWMHKWNEEDWNIWVAETKKDDNRRISQLRNKILNCNILDFGCGHCNFLFEAKKIANSVVGVEPDRSFESYIGEKLKEQQIPVYESIAELPDRKFDIITMFHVLEHLSNPIEILKQLRKKLVSNGVLIIETPNSNDALLSLYKCKAFSNFTYWSCHVILYNINTLKMLMNEVKMKGSILQIQRYPLANHLYWLAYGKSGGHKLWDFANKLELKEAYTNMLSEKEACDTLFGIFSI